MRPYGWPLAVGLLIVVGGLIMGVGGLLILPIIGVVGLVVLVIWLGERKARDKPIEKHERPPEAHDRP